MGVMELAGKQARLEMIVLSCLWCAPDKPFKVSGVATALKSILEADTSPEMPAVLERLAEAGDLQRIPATTKKGMPSFAITASGARRVAHWLGREKPPIGRTAFKSLLEGEITAMAADVPRPADAKAARGMGKLLNVAVVVRESKLSIDLNGSADAVKLALIKQALARFHEVPVESVYLKKLPPGELPALVAAPLIGAVGTAAGNLDKLLEARTCQILGVTRPSQIKAAVIRRWIRRDLGTREHLDGDFSQRVLDVARDVALHHPEGASNLKDKVLIHFAWRRFSERFGSVPAELFKQRLADANGESIALVREDLIPDHRRADVVRSEVRNGAAVFHYIRIPQG